MTGKSLRFGVHKRGGSVEGRTDLHRDCRQGRMVVGETGVRGGRMPVHKVVYALSGAASISFGLWQASIWAGLSLWFTLITAWEMVAYFIDNKR